MAACLPSTVRYSHCLIIVRSDSQLLLPPVELEQAQFERRNRLLSLATPALQSTGHDVPYSVLSKALQVEQNDIER